MLIHKKRLIIDATAAEFINPLIQANNYQVQAITPEIAALSVNLGSESNNITAELANN